MNIKTLFVKYIKLRNKLSKAKIYKIIDNTNDNVYIGSTCKTLKERLISHKCSYNRFLKGLYNNVKSFDIIKNNDYHIELLENCNIKTKQELFQRERYYIENNECLNKVIPGRSRIETIKAYNEANKDKQREYYEANKDKIKAYNEANKDKQREYYEANKDKIKESKKKYRDDNKDKIKAYNEANKDKQREYRDTNKDKVKAYREAYRNTNKDKIKAFRDANKDKQNEKCECECGGKFTISNKACHFKSTIHQKFIKSNN